MLQNVAAGATIFAAVLAYWRQTSGIAVLLLVTALLTVAAGQSKIFFTTIRGWSLARKQNRTACRHRKELGEFIGRLLEFTNSGRVDTLLYAVERIDPNLLQGIHPSSITEPLRFDLKLLPRLLKADLVVAYEKFFFTILLFNNGFVYQTLRKLKADQTPQPNAIAYREQADKALARWDRFLDDVDQFQRKLNREGSFELNNYFERSGRL